MDTRVSTAPERDLHTINPLITTNGDTTHVQAVLDFLSNTFLEAQESGLPLDHSQCLGLGLILESCKCALENME